MFRIWCRAKIADATITGAELSYEGSITIPADILKLADILPGEKVHVLNMNNGDRLETYVIGGKAGSGEIVLNGPAARKGVVGDRVVILQYVIGDTKEVAVPKIIRLDKKNRVKKGKK